MSYLPDSDPSLLKIFQEDCPPTLVRVNNPLGDVLLKRIRESEPSFEYVPAAETGISNFCCPAYLVMGMMRSVSNRQSQLFHNEVARLWHTCSQDHRAWIQEMISERTQPTLDMIENARVLGMHHETVCEACRHIVDNFKFGSWLLSLCSGCRRFRFEEQTEDAFERLTGYSRGL